jgi:NAD(P)-dependent dehydrogenase (short-subunit alcohol dehydrogenase family)
MIDKNLIRPGSVVLVSGGARGITARCVIELAERAHCKFILLGRTSVDENLPEWARNGKDEGELKRLIMEHMKTSGETPTPPKIQKMYRAIKSQREVEQTLQAIQKAGGRAEYLSVDITDAKALQEKLVEPVFRMGKVTGIIHGAGNLADKRIEKKSIQDFEAVFSPKVDGLENLLIAAPASQLDFLVLFSSVVGIYGNIGQADYAIANEILNKTALLLQRHNPNCRVISINWGPWEAGMVTPELKKAFQERGVEVIPVDVGARILVQELMPKEESNIQLVVGNLPEVQPEPLQAELHEYQIRRKMRLESNPFLIDHQIGERPVLPATCAATWIVNACEQLYPGYKFFDISNYKVLKGIVFDQTLADEYVLELKESAKTPSGEVQFDALIWSINNNGRKIYHYTAGVTLAAELPEAPVEKLPQEIYGDPEQEMNGQKLYEEGILFHGPAFQGVEKVIHISESKLVMQLRLPKTDERFQGQFPVQNKNNPYIYDAIVQILLIWTQVYHKAPCLPSSLIKMEQYRNIPFEEPCIVTMEVQSNTETAVVGNIRAQDTDGRVYVRFTALEGTISPLLTRLIKAHTNPEVK